ncbi:hypothetical protein BGX27_010229 [Mortierella sp. AM989]|nr:hypothetical protein BGX27_010229 [Mortierella sp. AM989]
MVIIPNKSLRVGRMERQSEKEKKKFAKFRWYHFKCFEVCRWVTFEILKTTELELRVKVVEKFIRIAQASLNVVCLLLDTCYNHSNFSSLTQIMVGLQVFEVSRLHRTWARVRPQEKKIMHELTEFTSMSRNWKHIRNAMKSIADEWGAAAPSVPATTTATSSGGQDGPTPTASSYSSSTLPSSGKQQGLNLFSKMTGRDKDKEKHQQVHQASNGNGGTSVVSPRYISHNHSSSFGKSSGHSMTTASASVSGSVLGHHKTSSGQLFPSLASFPKDKGVQTFSDKDKDVNKTLGGCIPLLAVYLSDLLYNTELPSYIEPKTFLNYDSTTPTMASIPDISSFHLLSPPQSAATTPYKATGYHVNPSSAAAVGSQTPPWMVNMHKHRTTATIIKRILTFRTMANRYPFVKDSDVYDQLVSIEAPDQLELERLSDLCEDRASSSGLASPVFAK